MLTSAGTEAAAGKAEIRREAKREIAARVLKTAGVAVGGGAVAGGLAGGVGSRLAMRIAAATEPACARLVTEGGNECGVFTGDGTLFLVLFGAMFFGAPGGVLYLGLRSWLRPLGRLRGASFGVVALAGGGWTVLDPHNVDFDRFGSPILNVVTFAAIFVVFGMLAAPIIDAVDRRVPSRPELRPFRLLPSAGYGVAALLGTLTLASLVVGTAGIAAFALSMLAIVAAVPRLVATRRPRARRAVYVAACTPVLVGTAVTVRNIWQIVG